jgi:hypothetical protein
LKVLLINWAMNLKKLRHCSKNKIENTTLKKHLSMHQL